MRNAGYTLIELLVVITILAILAFFAFTNYKDFSARQVAIRGAGQIQTYLRLVQSNATSLTKCPDPSATDQTAKSWQLFVDSTTPSIIDIYCTTSQRIPYIYRSYTLQNSQIDSICGATTYGTLTFTYSLGTGVLTMFSNDFSTNSCLQNSQLIIFNVTNTQNSNFPKTFTISKGGAIND